MQVQELIPQQTIEQLASAYQQTKSLLEGAYTMLEQASDDMKATFASKAGVMAVSLTFGRQDEALAELHRDAWRYVVDLTGIRDVLTPSRSEELSRQIRDNDLPEFTADNVQSTLEFLRGNLDVYLQEAVKEVYDFLRPRPVYGHYKTNSEYQVGKKVILSHMVETAYLNTIYHRAENKIRALDNVFSMLGGGGVVSYPGDLLTTIRTAIRAKEWKCETEKFKVKWYKKGTMHIEFKDMRLVHELNRIAGGGMIRPHD